MEPQNDQSTEQKVKKSTVFTKIATKLEAEKPLKSIRTLFTILGILIIIVGLVQSSNTSWGYLIIFIGLGFILCSYTLKKYKRLGSAYGLLFFSTLAVVIMTISISMGAFNLIAIFFYLLAFFSSIDAILIIKQIEKLKKIEDVQNTYPDNNQ